MLCFVLVALHQLDFMRLPAPAAMAARRKRNCWLGNNGIPCKSCIITPTRCFGAVRKYAKNFETLTEGGKGGALQCVKLLMGVRNFSYDSTMVIFLIMQRVCSDHISIRNFAEFGAG